MIPFILLLFGSVAAWHNICHALILQVALDTLDSATQSDVRKQLEYLQHDHLGLHDMYSSTNWPDLLKKQSAFEYTWRWHVVDMKERMKRKKSLRSSEANAIDQLATLLSPTRLSPLSNSNSWNLRMIVHIVGDLHQPLHTTGAFDQRVADVAPLFQPHGDAPLLHRPRCGRRSQPKHAAPRIEFALLQSKSPDDVSYLRSHSANIARLCSVSKSIDFQQWAKESYQTGEFIYRVVGNGTEVRLTDEQIAQLQSILLKQICLGGKHLGSVLQSLARHSFPLPLLCLALLVVMRSVFWVRSLFQKQHSLSLVCFSSVWVLHKPIVFANGVNP